MAGIERRWWLSALAGSVLAGGAIASGTFGPSWTYSSGNQFWIPRTVSLGDHGGQVLLKLGAGYDSTRLFSAHDWDPPTPVWGTTEGQATYFQRSSSADGKDVHVTLHDVGSTTAAERNVVLRRYRSTSSQPDWTFTFPITTNGHDSFDVAVSEDGSRIAAVVHNIWNGKEDVAVFDSDSGVPRAYTSISTLGPMRHLRLSADGSTLYMASDIKIALVDTATGSLVHSQTVFDTLFGAHAVSGDGSRFAYGTTGAVKVFERGANGAYAQSLVETLPGNWLGRRLSFSADGSRLAAAFLDAASFRSVRIQVLDVDASLTQGQTVVLSSRDVTGVGAWGNDISGLELSADGSRLAVGLWGDEQGQAPEVLVYEASSSAPLASYDLPGSVQDLDLSADGNTLVVASKAVHNNVAGGGGRVDVFDLSVGDLVLRGQPRTGQTVRIELQGTPGSEAHLLWSDSAASRGVVYPGVGTLQLERQNLQEVSLGLCDATGHAQADFVIPAGVPVGQVLYLQGLTLTPRTLTESWIEVTVLP